MGGKKKKARSEGAASRTPSFLEGEKKTKPEGRNSLFSSRKEKRKNLFQSKNPSTDRGKPRPSFIRGGGERGGDQEARDGPPRRSAKKRKKREEDREPFLKGKEKKKKKQQGFQEVPAHVRLLEDIGKKPGRTTFLGPRRRKKKGPQRTSGDHPSPRKERRRNARPINHLKLRICANRQWGPPAPQEGE